MEKIIIEAYKCEKCSQLYYNESSAINCCKSGNCNSCGKEISQYRSECDECIKKQKFKSATKYTYEQYVKEFPDNYIFYNDKYYRDIEELSEDIYEYDCEDKVEFPKYVYGTNEIIIDIDIENVICNAEEDSDVEDFEFNNTKELIDFVNKWNKNNSQKTYAMTYNKVIYVSKEME
jgi:hypothetical protein